MATKKTATEPEVNELGEELVTIKLPLTRDDQDDVFVRVNERTWLIKRGEYVKVPQCVVEILDRSEDQQMEALEYQRKVERG